METQQIIKYAYNGQEVEFDLVNKNVMVNATEMAKCFGKRIDVFLKTEPTKAFINALLKSQILTGEFPPIGGNSGINSEKDLIQTRGQNGTWMHRKLALKFAAWLDPDFEVWVFSTIDELLFGDAIQRKQLLSESMRLKREIMMLKEELKDNELYRKLVDKEAELLRLGKDLKANDQAETNKQLGMWDE